MSDAWTNAYMWIKSLHLLFVVAWMATVFYLPRILVNIAEVGDLGIGDALQWVNSLGIHDDHDKNGKKDAAKKEPAKKEGGKK